MTLKEKFEKVPILYEGAIGRLEYDEFKNTSIKCEQIADEFAIGFAEWCVKNELFYSIQYGRIETKSLLEIYKKEKGL